MELKPEKKMSKALYPTIGNVQKTNFMKGLLLIQSVPPHNLEFYPVAVPSYMPKHMPVIMISIVLWWISIILSVFSIISLGINKIKINKYVSKNENAEKVEKLNKFKKISWWILVISIVVIAITSILIGYLEYCM